MGDGPDDAPETVAARFALRRPGGTIEAEMAVPTGPIRVNQILPMAQSLADGLVALAVNEVEAEGRTVSCRAESRGVASRARQFPHAQPLPAPRGRTPGPKLLRELTERVGRGAGMVNDPGRDPGDSGPR